tara:strand:+ start:673 stop:936 length:264 start_codon:yes stop_codon:yes gene_type:complete
LVLGRKRLKEREKTDPRKREKVNFHPSISGVRQMNTLNLIKKQIEKASALHDAQIANTAYRGVEYTCKQDGDEVHGTFCYRGRTYVK